jgi:chromosome segregation protein
MTPRLTRLRIAGFKSFAEAVSLDILPGLTGVVGPNGCGKSNVVEALRWAMGETSARSLRGGEMDDVIFAGTTARPSRNLAEVTITLERAGEAEGLLPQPFEAEAELQITRRIERGAGSQFRANGRELRARDVQTLYADLASGARSSGMVSQGRVSQLVNAKPEERRQVLEEAAGITGLHARRHEAELKLRAAEQNVTRAEDLRVQLEAAREGLRKQARQASRYRNISGLIRAAEAEHLAVLLAQAQAALTAAQAAQAVALAERDEAAQEIQVSGEALEEAEQALPALREAEAEARSLLERRRLEAESLAAESARVAREAAEAESRLLELETDCEAALRGQADAKASVERLDAESQRLRARLETLPAEVAAGRETLATERDRVFIAQQAADDAAAAARDAMARANQARLSLDAAEVRLSDMRALHAAAVAAQEDAQAALIEDSAIAQAETAVRLAETALMAAREDVDAADSRRADAERTHLAARASAVRALGEAQSARRAHAEIVARADAAGVHAGEAAAVLTALNEKRVAPARLEQAAVAVTAAQTRLEGCEAALEAADRAAARALAERAAAARQLDDLRAAAARAEAALRQTDSRSRAVESEWAEAEQALAEAERSAPPQAEADLAAVALAEAEQVFAARRQAAERLQAGSAQASNALAAAREAASLAEAEAARLAAEAEGLRAAIGPANSTVAVLDAITVPEGLEAALGAALGDACMASLDEGASVFFRCLPPDGLAALPPPDGAQRFDTLIESPAALARVFAACVLLAPGMDGDALQQSLPTGMVAVTREGACWRWDGHTVRAGAPNAAATRLRQTNRLHAVDNAHRLALAEADAARASCDAAGRDEAAAKQFETAARDGLNQAEHALRTAHAQSASLSARRALAEARRATLLPMVERLAGERTAATLALAEARREVQALPSVGQAEAALAQAGDTAEREAAAVETARLARSEARSQLAAAQADATALRDMARDIEQRIAGQMPLLARARADHDSALRQVAGSEEALAALPDAAALADADRAAEAALRVATDTQTACRAARKVAEEVLDGTRAALAALKLRAAQTRSEAEARAAMALRARQDLDLAERQQQDAAEQMAGLPDHAALAHAAEAAKPVLDAARAAMTEALSTLNTLEAELRQADIARDLAGHDLIAWQTRLAEASERAGILAARRDAAREAHKSLADTPAIFAAKASASVAGLDSAQSMHRTAHDRLQGAEQRVRALALARRDAETQSVHKRETLLRAEAASEAAAAALASTLARAAERLGDTAELPEARDTDGQSEERARRKLERLGRERDEMGPVNLRAELELEELDQRLSTLEQEREELSTAIAKLRGAIGHLNREGRARLEAVFQQVDAHFRTLFTRMMGGGRAHLALTGSDDPLSAGLEIYAEPPGKKLSALSLLSGGEQALTALSLIFAVFRCTPAPVSVLDEVDAPLDDANVERFCTLLEDIVRDTGTRFLVVTHHQLTMSRMDRLFGVTMQERGVSRLLSVDLQRAAAMVEPRLQAAE